MNLAWVFFRAPDLASAWDLLRIAFAGGRSLPASWLVSDLLANEREALWILLPELEPRLNALMMVLLYGAGMAVVLYPRSMVRELEEGRCPGRLRCVLLAVAAAWAILSFSGVTTFIYSNF